MKCQSCIYGKALYAGMYFCQAQQNATFSVQKCDLYHGKAKFNNVKTTTAEGLTFDSKKEAARFSELMMMQNAGYIQDLRRQVKFEIVPKSNTENAAFYVADFVYSQDGRKIIEDVKSEVTRKLPLYILKRKLVKYIYKDYTFMET